jgi:hypothetical protein
MSTMFNFNPADYAKQFSKKGYVHIRKGVTDTFFDLLVKQVDAYLDANRLKEWAIGNKQQSLYEFPDSSDYYDQFMQAVSAVCGLNPKRLTLSERHIKAYEPNANPNPLAHKDRYASQISVGFSVSVPPGSRLVLYPKDELWVNTYNTSARLRASLTEENAPETTLKHAAKVVIEDQPGDVMIFRGNAIWHLRENPANTTNLYLKLNAFNCDPLGEDPHTEAMRARTLAAVQLPDKKLNKMIPMLGRRVDYVHRQMSRDWKETREVVFWGDRTFPLTRDEFRLLKNLGWKTTVKDLLQKTNGEGSTALRRLAAEGVVDLFEHS